MRRRPLVDLAWFANDLAQFPVFHVDWRKNVRVSISKVLLHVVALTGRSWVVVARRVCVQMMG